VVGGGFVAEADSAMADSVSVGVKTVTIGVGGTVVGKDVGMSSDVQATMRKVMRMSTII